MRSAADLGGMHGIDAAADLPYVMDAIRLVRHELDGSTPLIGFSGAPFTLASYIVEGGHSRAYVHIKQMMYRDAPTFGRLMRIISDVVVGYLLAQIAAGAQVVQLFDSWVGWIGPYDYERLVLPHVRSVIARVKGHGAPLIYFANGASGMLPHVARAASEVVGIDWRIELDRAWGELNGVAIQGNLGPHHAARRSPRRHRGACGRRSGAGRGPPQGHIFNLGHGLIPQTPIDNVKYLVDAVHRLSAGRQAEGGPGAMTESSATEGRAARSLVDVALLPAYGGPHDMEQIPDFLRRLTGRPPQPQMLAAVEERYRRIGGASPLPGITARQARALQARLVQELAFPLRVSYGFLYVAPTVADCLRELDGEDVLAVPLSPFASRLTTGKYRAALDAAGRADIPLLEGWYAGRGFVRALGKRVAEALDGADASEWAVLFTAHNVPAETVSEGDPYVEQLQHSISQLLPVITPGDWRFAFQSKGRGGGEWLEPEADDAVRALAEDGWKKILVVPIGFVSDNVETLYDLDVVLRAQVESLGVEYRRSPAPNDAPLFIEALAEVVIDHLARRPLEQKVKPSDGPHSHG